MVAAVWPTENAEAAAPAAAAPSPEANAESMACATKLSTVAGCVEPAAAALAASSTGPCAWLGPSLRASTRLRVKSLEATAEADAPAEPPPAALELALALAIALESANLRPAAAATSSERCQRY